MKSRINPLLTPGDIVTDPRSQAYYIVTEYGGVNLVGCSTWERAEKLISIAHPMFRDELIANAEIRASGSSPTSAERYIARGRRRRAVSLLTFSCGYSILPAYEIGDDGKQ